MNSLLKLIRSQGLITFLAVFEFGSATTTSGLAALAVIPFDPARIVSVERQ